MFRLLAGGFALALLALATNAISAEDKKDKDKVTTWERKAGDITLKYEMGKDTAKYHVAYGDNAMTISSKFKIEKDVVTAEITDVEVKGEFPAVPKKGDKMIFKWVVKDNVATLTDLKGDKIEDVKAVVEGEYKKK